MLAKKTDWNRLTLPPDIARKFAQVDYFDVREAKGVLLLTPVRERAQAEKKLRGELQQLGISEDDIRAAAAALTQAAAK